MPLRTTKTPRAQVLCDYQRNHFQLLRTGWRGKDYRFGVIFYFDIQDGKLGMQPAEDRAYTDFATA